MNRINSTTLADITIGMLERTAMVLAELAAESDEYPAPTRFARITYRGPGHGTLVLGATEGFLRELAASLLGVEGADVSIDTHGGDALKEMANIVGGSVILALSGDACEFSLGLPELVPDEYPRGHGTPPSAQCTVVADGGPLCVFWYEAGAARAA